MLEPIRDILQKAEIVFASDSPSRIQVAKDMGLGSIFQFHKSNFKEDLDKKKYTHEEYVMETALYKVLYVEKSLKNEPDVVIAADTMVKVGDELYGKPKTDDEARAMLKSLSHKSNDVLTGTVIKFRGEDPDKFVVKTTVHFGEITDAQIEKYIETKEYKKFAGGYAIQGKLGTLITGIEGDYYSILGFPVNEICKRLNNYYKRM